MSLSNMPRIISNIYIYPFMYTYPQLVIKTQEEYYDKKAKHQRNLYMETFIF